MFTDSLKVTSLTHHYFFVCLSNLKYIANHNICQKSQSFSNQNCAALVDGSLNNCSEIIRVQIFRRYYCTNHNETPIKLPPQPVTLQTL